MGWISRATEEVEKSKKKALAMRLPLAPKAQQETPAVPVLPKMPKTETKQPGTGYSAPAPLPMIKKPAASLPEVNTDILERAKQIGQQAKGKTAEQVRAQNLQSLKDRAAADWELVKYGAENLGAGALGALEDAGKFIGTAGLQGASKIAGAIKENPGSKTLAEAAEYFANIETLSDKWNKRIEEVYKPTEEMQVAGNINQGFGRLLPVMATGAVGAAGTGIGSASQAQAVQNAGQILFGAGAAGAGMKEAIEGGATVDQAVAYGTASAITEMTIERIAGNIPGLPKGKVTQIIEAAKGSPLMATLADLVGEGGEEALSEFITPYLRRALYDPDAPNATAEEIWTAAANGMAVGLAAQAAGGNINLRTKPSTERLTTRAETPRLSAEDFANNESPVWHNVDYTDKETQAKITTELDEKMKSEGKTVTVTQEDLAALDQYFPNLRGLKKKERLPLMKKSIADLKDYLRGVLSSFKDSSIEFTVNGNILEAKLYNTGINEVLEKVTQDKAAMLEKSREIFDKAEYLYSTQDKAGDANVLRWNYFYVPLNIDGEQVGVRIAVRDVVSSNESQIYNWGIKKGTGTAYDGQAVTPIPSATSAVPTETVTQEQQNVKRPASLRQIDALKKVPSMEDRNSSAKTAIDAGMTDDVVKMLETEDDGMTLTAQSDLSDVAGAIQGAKAGTTLDISRMLDAVAKGNTKLRQRLYEAVEKPLLKAKAGYARNITERLKSYKADMDRLGIKVGSEESAAVQWYGEKQRQTGVNGETIPYSLDQLKQEFPDTWQNIVEAEKIHRQIYDEYVQRINAALKQIYPEVEAKANEELGIAKANMEHALWELATQERLVQELKVQEAQLRAQMQSGNLVEAARARQDLAKLQRDIEAEVKYATTLSEKATKAAETHRDLEAKINSSEYFRGKRLMPRQDYFHHFIEMEETGTIKGLRNMLNRPSDIAPELVGLSEFTKPKSKWSGWLQQRKGGRYTEDAVAGMARYIPMAEYKINIEPYIAQMRGMVKSVVDATKETRNANGFIDYMTQFTNDLAGKTHKIDRAVQSERTRKPLKVLEWLNQRASANAVIGNLGSAIVQFSNIPNATIYVQNPMHWINSLGNRLNGSSRALLAQSSFLTERYITNSTDLFSKKTPVRKFAEGMMEIGDKLASEQIWLAAYNQYEAADGKVKGTRQYENAVDYADDITRRSVAGRGVGEMPPILKSKVVKMIAPFQVEVTNSFNLMKEQIGEKNARGLLLYCVNAYALNSLMEAVLNRRIIFDPINALIEAWKLAKGDEEEEGNIMAAIARLGGEAISAIPGASSFIPLFFDVEDMEAIFGEENPTRYGTGMLATGPIGAAGASIRKGKAPDLLEIGTTYLTPYGGTQLERFVEASQDVGILPRRMIVDEEGTTKLQRAKSPANYNDAGKLRFALNGPGDIALDYLFGPYATTAGREYVNEGKTPLNEQKTFAANMGQKYGIPLKTYEEYIASVDRNKNGSVTQDEAKKTLNQTDLTTNQKAYLYGKTNKSWKNNPFY